MILKTFGLCNDENTSTISRLSLLLHNTHKLQPNNIKLL